MYKITDGICKCCTNSNVYCCSIQNSKFLMHCLECGVYFFAPSPTVSELKSHYEGTYSDLHRQQLFDLLKKNYEQGDYKGQVNLIKSYLDKKNMNKIKILDYGSGYGFFAKAAHDEGFESWGVEYDPEVSRYNEKELGIRMVSDEQLEKIPDEFFDIIRANHVLEHLPNPVKVLEVFYKKLKKNGIIAISSPCFSENLVQSNSIKIFDLVYPDHLFYFTNGSIRKLLERIGFKVEVNITQFANSDMALKWVLGINQNLLTKNDAFRSSDFSELCKVLEANPFFSGNNLFTVGRKDGEKLKSDIQNSEQSSNIKELRIHYFSEYFQINGKISEGHKIMRKLENSQNSRGMYFNVNPEGKTEWNLLFPFKTEVGNNRILISGNILSLNSWLNVSLYNEKIGLLKNTSGTIEINNMNTFEFSNEFSQSGDYYVCISGNGKSEFFVYDLIVTEN